MGDQRIVDVTEHSVTYRFKPKKSKTMPTRTVSGQSFVRGFAQHILPTGFRKVRYFGWMASNSRTKLEELRMIVWFSLGWVYWLATAHSPATADRFPQSPLRRLRSNDEDPRHHQPTRGADVVGAPTILSRFRMSSLQTLMFQYFAYPLVILKRSPRLCGPAVCAVDSNPAPRPPSASLTEGWLPSRRSCHDSESPPRQSFRHIAAIDSPGKLAKPKVQNPYRASGLLEQSP